MEVENKKLKLEKISLFIVYKQDGLMHGESSIDVNDYELYGFLKCYLLELEQELRESIDKSDAEW